MVDRGKRTDDPEPQPTPPARIEPAKVKLEVKPRVTRGASRLWFRVVDAADRKPIGLARIVIDNLNLAPELGEDSDAVTWSDGRAIVRHQFFVWEERPGDARSAIQSFEGPWIHVSAEG